MAKDNLKPFSSEKAKNFGSMGGKASGVARVQKRKLQDALQKALNGSYKINDGELERELGGYDALAVAMILEAATGNVKAFVAIRDTIGEKPKDIVGVESEGLSGIKIKFVNKSLANTKPERDPKIVGEFTKSTNLEEE